MKIFAPILLSVSALAGQAAFASPATDRLSTCLTDNTSGKDRKDLARWIFVAMSVHPEIRSLSAVTPETRDEADKAMAALVTRLLTVNCEKQTREVASVEGNVGMYNAFRALGEVAMRELMGSPEVAASVGGYVRHLDQKKLESVFRSVK
jgi:hypothetical protein